MQSVIDLQLPVVIAVEGMHPGSGQLEHPAQVFGQDKMPGRPEDVRSDQSAFRKRLLKNGILNRSDPLGERPLRRTVVLGLHRTQLTDDLGVPADSRAGEPDAAHPSPGDLRGIQASVHFPNDR
jgi:hypothetical protein